MTVFETGVCGDGVEQSVDECDLSSDPWLFVMDVTALDRSYRLEPLRVAFADRKDRKL